MLRLASLALATHAAAAADACVDRAALRDQWTATGSVDVDAAETEACGDAEAARAPYDRDRELSIQMLLPDSLWFGAEGVVEHLPILKTPQRAGVELCHSFAAAGSAETLAEACEPASEKLRPRKHRFGAAGRYVFRAWLTGARFAREPNVAAPSRCRLRQRGRGPARLGGIFGENSGVRTTEVYRAGAHAAPPLILQFGVAIHAPLDLRAERPTIVLGVFLGHDAHLALLRDGELLEAYELERATGERHFMPHHANGTALRETLDAHADALFARHAVERVDFVAYAENPMCCAYASTLVNYFDDAIAYRRPSGNGVVIAFEKDGARTPQNSAETALVFERTIVVSAALSRREDRTVRGMSTLQKRSGARAAETRRSAQVRPLQAARRDVGARRARGRPRDGRARRQSVSRSAGVRLRLVGRRLRRE